MRGKLLNNTKSAALENLEDNYDNEYTNRASGNIRENNIILAKQSATYCEGKCHKLRFYKEPSKFIAQR
jgi:hypothetical protein